MRRFVLAIALGLILLALNVIVVSAQSPEDDFKFNFSRYSSARDWVCHPDDWGQYVGGVPSTCAQDFHSACGEALPAPFTGTLYVYGNSEAVFIGKRWLMTLLHGDYPEQGTINQGDTVGWQNTHGNSTGCHWHMGLFDRINGVWVDPHTLSSDIPAVSQNQSESIGFEPVSKPPDELMEILANISIQTSSTVVEESVEEPTQPVVSPTLATSITETPAPVPQSIESTNPTNFYVTWGILLALMVASGSIAWGSKELKAAGLVLLILLGFLGYWLFDNGFLPVFYIEEPTSTPNIIVSTQEMSEEPTQVPAELDRQVEEIVITDVVLTGLPSMNQNSTPPEGDQSSPPNQNPPSGECAINPRWPSSIQQWCPWITTYAIKNGLGPDWAASVTWQESKGNPNAMSVVTATGLIQVMPSNGYIGTNDEAGRAAYVSRFTGENGFYFRDRPTIEQLRDPEFNLAYGLAYLGGLQNKYGSIMEALLHYGGIGYGETYRGAVKAHYDCIVNQIATSCTDGLSSQ